MSRQPFITADLRPDPTVASESDMPMANGRAIAVQPAEAAAALLPQEEFRQIDRGTYDKTGRLMAAVPHPNPDVQGTTLDGETVLLDLSTGRDYRLNRVGTAIWQDCNGRRSLQEIHQVLCERFDASSERIADDLFALVTQLGHEGFLTLERG